MIPIGGIPLKGASIYRNFLFNQFDFRRWGRNYRYFAPVFIKMNYNICIIIDIEAVLSCSFILIAYLNI